MACCMLCQPAQEQCSGGGQRQTFALPSWSQERTCAYLAVSPLLPADGARTLAARFSLLPPLASSPRTSGPRRNWLVNTFFLQGLLTAVTPNFLISGCGFSKVKHVVQTKNIYHFLLAVLAINRLQSVTLEWWPLCIWTVHLITEKPLNVDKEPPTIAAWRCCAHSLLPLEWFSILGKLQL